VHAECLKTWLRESRLARCELCREEPRLPDGRTAAEFLADEGLPLAGTEARAVEQARAVGGGLFPGVGARGGVGDPAWRRRLRVVNLVLLLTFLFSLAVAVGFMAVSWVRFRQHELERRAPGGSPHAPTGGGLAFRSFEEWDAAGGLSAAAVCGAPPGAGGARGGGAGAARAMRCVLPLEVFHRERPFQFGGCGAEGGGEGAAGAGPVAGAADAAGVRKPCGEWARAHLVGGGCEEVGAACSAVLLPSRALGGACSPAGECIAASFLSYFSMDGVSVEGVCACPA